MTLALTTLANVKESLGITVTTYDDYLNHLITRFSKLAENYIGRGDLTSQSLTEGYDGDGQLQLVLRRFPVSAIGSITIDGSVLDSTTYKLLRNGVNGLVQRTGSGFTGQLTTTYAGERWPSSTLLVGGPPERIQVTYTAGYTLADVPDLEQAAIESITLWFARRLYGTGYISEALGSYTYTLDKSPVNLNGVPLPTEVISIMNRYKEIPIC